MCLTWEEGKRKGRGGRGEGEGGREKRKEEKVCVCVHNSWIPCTVSNVRVFSFTGDVGFWTVLMDGEISHKCLMTLIFCLLERTKQVMLYVDNGSEGGDLVCVYMYVS